MDLNRGYTSDLSAFLPPKNLWPDLAVPEEFTHLPDELNLTDALLDRHLREGRGEQTAICFEDQAMTYREIAYLVNRLGSSLLDLGFQPQDRIGIRMMNIPEAVIANFAIMKIGAIPVPISPLWSRKEIAYVSRDAYLQGIVVNDSLLREILEIREGLPFLKAFIVVSEGNPDEKPRKERFFPFEELILKGRDNISPYKTKKDDVAILLYTSGTTGLPKGCAHTVSGVLINASLITRYIWDLEEGDVLAGSAPISFAAGFGTFALIPWTSRGAISLLAKFSPEALFRNIERHKVTVLTGIPAAYRRLLEMEKFEDYDLSRLRLCTVGADALGETTYEAWMARTGLPIWENLGTTEFFNIIISNRMGSKPKPGSLGLPLRGYEVKVIDEEGHLLPPGKTGSLCVKGPTGILYWNPYADDGRLLKAQETGIRDGWSLVGDAVFQDEEGYIHFVAREDDMIKSSGYRISPGEIEEVLGNHPAVSEVAVIGVPDRVKGQIVKAFVVLKGEKDVPAVMVEDLKEYCRERMAIYKIPRVFSFAPSLPRTPTGKIIKRELKEWNGEV